VQGQRAEEDEMPYFTQVFVDKVNSQATTWTAKLYDRFADQTLTELKRNVLPSHVISERIERVAAASANATVSVGLPDSFDWRQEGPGWIKGILDQGK
jgi:hypothetical protein